jgi:bacterioferritin-associated ferredoxin
MHLHGERRTYTGKPDEMVCECLSVERSEIEEAIETVDAMTVGEVRRECAAGGGCGSCHEEIARLILSRCFGETLVFDSSHEEDIDLTRTEKMLDRELAGEIEQFLANTINPRISPFGITANLAEFGEEVVLDLRDASEELKYTLSFWIASEFDRRFSHSITVIIA